MKVEENHVHNQGLNFYFDLFFLHLWSGWRRRWSNHSPTLRLSAYRIYMRGTDLKPHCLLNPGRVSGAPSLPHSTSSSIVSSFFPLFFGFPPPKPTLLTVLLGSGSSPFLGGCGGLGDQLLPVCGFLHWLFWVCAGVCVLC